MGRKALSTGYRTEEQQEVLADLDDALADCSRRLNNATTEEITAWENYKDTHPGGSLEKARSGFKKARAELRDKKEYEKSLLRKVKVKKTSGNTREYRDNLRAEMVAAAKRGDKRKVVGLAIALGVAQDIL